MNKNGAKTDIKRQKRTETDRNGPTWKKWREAIRNRQKLRKTERNRLNKLKRTETDSNTQKRTKKRTETH